MPMPRVRDFLDNLEGQSYFTTLDMIKTYHHGFMHKPSSPLATFTLPWRLYEWIRIPFGLCNAPPAEFPRRINKCLGDLRGTSCITYLD